MAMKIRTRRFTVKVGKGVPGMRVGYKGPKRGMNRNIEIIKKAIKGALRAKKH